MTETQDRAATNGSSPDGDGDGEDGGQSVAPSERLKEAAQTLLKAVTDKAVGSALDKVEGLTGRLTDVAESGGSGLSNVFGGGGSDDDSDDEGGGGFTGAIKSGFSTVKDKVTGALGIGGDDDDEGEGDEDGSGGGGSSGSGRGKFKFMNITEQIDVGVPIRVAYDAWTQFGEFSGFMKKVESVDQEDDAKQNWKAQVFWSHRTWEATIREQVPDSHIIWVSSGAKGHADGCVSFHELAPNMTRIILVMEYYPQGFFEKTANLWRAVGRRTRLEFKHFARHVTMDTLINRDELEGWRGEIRDSEVVKTHEEAMEEEQAAAEEADGAEDSDLEDGEPAEDELDEDELADDELADDELEPEEGEDGDLAEDEYDDDVEDLEDPGEEPDDVDDEYEDLDEDDEPEDSDEEPEPEPERPRRRSRQRTPA